MVRTKLPFAGGSGGEGGEVEWILRAGVFACFVGHGAFGLLRKPEWLAYFDALGIEQGTAHWLMPLVGTLDITVGFAALLRPGRAVLAWAALWGLATALLRPLAGEPVWEVVERAGNYGVPLALLLLLAGRPPRLPKVGLVLQASTSLLLLGHGLLAIAGKPLLLAHAAAVSMPPRMVPVLGAAEVGLAIVAAGAPSAALLMAIAAWKLATELLFPLSGAPLWELVERGGSYAAPLALALLVARGRVAAAPLWKLSAAPARAAALLALALCATAPSPAAAQPSPGRERWAEVTREPPSGGRLDAIATELRGGGLTLFCRHAVTDHDAGDRGPSREQQRNLDAAGRDQARRMGRALADAGVPVGDVRASPMFRTMDSAELAFGRVTAEPVLRGSDGSGELLRLLSEPPEGGNRVLESHQGVIRRVVAIGRSPLAEGDCLVIRPLGVADGFEVLGRVGAADWERLGPSGEPSPAEAAIAAARAGGTVILCRHAITQSTREVEPVDYDDPSTQRLLSEEGRRQSASIGGALRALGVEVSELVASPMGRARETASLMLGLPVAVDSVWHTNGGSYGGPALELRARVLSTPVARGNRLIVSHIADRRLGPQPSVVRLLPPPASPRSCSASPTRQVAKWRQ